MTARTLTLTALLLLSCFAAAQEPQEDLLYRAFYLEKALRDFPAAAATYAQAAEQAARTMEEDQLIVALMGQARCLTALGRNDEARSLHERVLVMQPGHEEALAALDRSREGLTREDELDRRIATLIQRLSGPDRENARGDLLKIGPRAVPLLQQALESTDVGLVTGAAFVLSRIGTQQAFEALTRHLASEECLFPKVLVDSLTGLGKEAAHLSFLEAGLLRPEPEVRAAALRQLPGDREPHREALASVLLRACAAHPDLEQDTLKLFPSLAAELAPMVEEALRSSDDALRLAAVHSLARDRRSAGDFLPQLVERLEDPVTEVREYAWRAVESTVHQDSRHAPVVLAAAVQVLADPEQDLVLRAAQTLDSHRGAWPAGAATAVDQALRRLITGQLPERVASNLDDLLSPREGGLSTAALLDLLGLLESEECALHQEGRRRLGGDIVKQLERHARGLESGARQQLMDQALKLVPDPELRVYLVDEWLDLEGALPALAVHLASGEDPLLRRHAYRELASYHMGRASRPTTEDVGLDLELPHLASDLLSEDRELSTAASQVLARGFRHAAVYQNIPWTSSGPRLVRWSEELARGLLVRGERLLRGELPHLLGPPMGPWETLSSIAMAPSEMLPSMGLVDQYALAGGELPTGLDTSYRRVVREVVLRHLQQQGLAPERAREVLRAGVERIRDEEGLVMWLQQLQQLAPAPRVLALAARADAPQVRLAAYWALLQFPAAGLPDDLELPHLAKDLFSENGDLCWAVLSLLTRMPAPALVEPLRRFHADATGKERIKALDAQVHQLGQEARGLLLGEATSADRKVRSRATMHLVKLWPDRAVQDLVRLAQDDGVASQVVAALYEHARSLPEGLLQQTLVSFVQQVPPELLDEGIFSYRDALPPALQQQLILSTLEHGTPGGKKLAATLAGNRRLEEAWPLLQGLLDQSNSDLRGAAIEALQNLRSFRELRQALEAEATGGSTRALAQARELLGSEDPLQRRGAAHALGALGALEAIPDLLGLLTDEDPGVREAAAAALEHLGHQDR